MYVGSAADPETSDSGSTTTAGGVEMTGVVRLGVGVKKLGGSMKGRNPAVAGVFSARRVDPTRTRV